jgi:HAD superfamily hydrolase (TIGR01549 family)
VGATAAICFDAFGTLCRIREPRHPYRRLFERLGVRPREAARIAMTTGEGLEQFAARLDPGLAPLATELLGDLAAELASVELFEEVPGALAELTRCGLKVWVASNLAPPYAGPLRRLLAGLADGLSLSFEVGAVKPEPAIFAHVCAGLNLPASRVLVVGDSPRADVEGARSFGMRAVRLARGEPSAWPNRIGSLTELVTRRTGLCL